MSESPSARSRIAVLTVVGSRADIIPARLDEDRDSRFFDECAKAGAALSHQAGDCRRKLSLEHDGNKRMSVRPAEDVSDTAQRDFEVGSEGGCFGFGGGHRT